MYLCRSHIRHRNRPRLCRTRKINLVRTSPRASPTPCGNSALLCRLRRPGNSRSHPGQSVCTAASRHTAPGCICPGSSPRTWRWRPTLQHPAAEVRRALWWGAETSLDAGESPSKAGAAAGGSGGGAGAAAGGFRMCGLFGESRSRGSPLEDSSGVTSGSSGCMVISDEQLCFAHGLPLVNFLIPVLSSLLPVSPLFRNPVWKWD